MPAYIRILKATMYMPWAASFPPSTLKKKNILLSMLVFCSASNVWILFYAEYCQLIFWKNLFIRMDETTRVYFQTVKHPHSGCSQLRRCCRTSTLWTWDLLGSIFLSVSYRLDDILLRDNEYKKKRLGFARAVDTQVRCSLATEHVMYLNQSLIFEKIIFAIYRDLFGKRGWIVSWERKMASCRTERWCILATKFFSV